MIERGVLVRSLPDRRCRVCVCLCVCPSQAIPQKLLKLIIIKLGTVTASDMRMHHVLVVLNLTFIQGHTDLSHENNECSIISETKSMLTGGCLATCSNLPLSKPMGFLPAVRLCDLDFENIYMA